MSGVLPAHSSDFVLNRCEEAKGIDSRSLSVEEAKSFRKWLIKCETNFIDDLIENKYARMGGVDYPLYPVLGKKERVADETTEDGFRIVYSNPENYVPKWDKVLANPETAACDVPAGYSIVAFCRASCYTPDQQLKFAFEGVTGDLVHDYMPIVDAVKMQHPMAVTLRPNVSIDDLVDIQSAQKASEVLAYIVSPKVSEHDVIDFVMKSGGMLTVTTNHPLVDDQGILRIADKLKVGDSLMRQNGDGDTIVAMQARKYKGKVYNLDLVSTNNMENIVIAQGYLSGSARFQNEKASLANRILLRNSLVPKELL